MIRKAVIPAAGFGTRFLPASKAQPKEMLPVVDKPTIQYVVEEAVASGVRDILIILGKGKRAIMEHFDRNFELEAELAGKGRQAELEEVRRISELANIHFIRQRELRGLGDAILCARDHVGDEPFAVLLGDTLVTSPVPVTAQLAAVHERFGETVVALERVPAERVGRYGIVAARPVDGNVSLVSAIVEKPSPAEAPSDLAVAGRYVLVPEIFDILDRTPAGRNGEIQLTDAIRLMLDTRAVYGVLFDGARHDMGNKLDFLKTNIDFALAREDLRAPLLEHLRRVARA